jgi:hypothetical protein
VASRSPPSAPLQKAVSFSLPPDLSAMHSVIAFTPLPTGWVSATPFETRMVRSWISASAGPLNTPTLSASARPLRIADFILFLRC